MIARLAILLALLLSAPLYAQEYVLSLDADERLLPPCSESWTYSTGAQGIVYICRNGTVSLNSGDSVIASSKAVLKADGGFSFSGSNTIGSETHGISLQSSYGSFQWQGVNNRLFGGFTAENTTVSLSGVEMNGGVDTGGNVVITNSALGGGVRSVNSTVTITNSQVAGDVYANGNITVQPNSRIEGDITTPNNRVSISGAEVTGNISANGNITINDSSVVGDISTPNNSVTINSSEVFGNVSANGNVTVDNSFVDGDLTSTNNRVILNNGSDIVGNVTAGQPNWGTVEVNGGSTVDGTCLYQTIPANACGVLPLPDPIAWYHLEESSWSGSAGEVKDVSGNNLHGRALNGALTATSTPALPAIDQMGTCGYGYFNHDNNQYIEVPDNNLLDFSNEFTASAWVYPTSQPSGSGLHSIFSKDTNFEVHLNSTRKVFWWWQESNGSTRTLTSSNALPLNTWSFITLRYNSQNSQATIFINGEVAASSSSNQTRSLRTNANPFQIGQDQNYAGRAFDGAIDEVQLFDSALTNQQVTQLYRQRHLCDDTVVLQCFTDDFSSGQLSDLWVTSTSKGTFQPQVISNRLRFTEAVRNQATSSTYQRLFPAQDNLVEIEFDHFAYGGSGADGIAVVLSDSGVTPKAGAFGGPLGYGYKPNEPGFAGGWLGLGLDEYGNFSNEGGSNGPGRRRQSVALRGSGSGESGYRYLAGACNNGQTNTNGECLNPKVDGNNSGSTHRYKIVVDSRQQNESQVEISRKIGAGSWQTIVGPVNVLDPQYNQSSVPEDFLLSITGSTGGATNVHEIDNFQVCALKSSPIEEQIDHFRITHTGEELTCNAGSVTIQACLDSDCSSLYTGQVTATLTPNSVSGGGGWVGGNVVTFSGGSATFDIRKNQPGTLTLGVSGSTPTAKPFSTNLCNKGNGWSENNCDLTFVDSGFLVEVPDKIANAPVVALIQAVEKSNSAQQCVPSFENETKTVDFWSDYLAPIKVEIVGEPVVTLTDTFNSIGINESSATSIDITFDDQGKAEIPLNYPDAGMLALNARYTGVDDEAGLVMTGSDSFVSFPKYLQVEAINDSGDNGQCVAADVSCALFAKAGQSFELNVTAFGEGDVVTPNYQHSNMVISHQVIAPSDGVPGNLGESSYDHQPIENGVNTVKQSVDEVGVFQFTVTPPEFFNGSNAYPIPVVTSENVGRFYPAYFSIAATTPELQAGCDVDLGFTYLGQTFSYSIAPGLWMYPNSVDGDLTTNYLDPQWWRYNSQWDNRSYEHSGIGSAIDLKGSASVERLDDTSYLVELVDEELEYGKPSVPVEPFQAMFDLELNVSDLTDSDGVCYKTSDEGECQTYVFEDIDSEMWLRWGKLVIHDTYGSELRPLQQKLELQYFENNQFTRNTDDSCTSFVAVNRFDFSSSDYTVITSEPTAAGQVGVEFESTSGAGSPSVEEGLTWLSFSKPFSNDAGKITTSFNMDTQGLPWLKIDDDLDGSFSTTTSGTVQFGLYRGNDRVIWWSEKNE